MAIGRVPRGPLRPFKLAVTSPTRTLIFDPREPATPLCCIDPPPGESFGAAAALSSNGDTLLALATQRSIFWLSPDGHELAAVTDSRREWRELAVTCSPGRVRLFALGNDGSVAVFDRQLK